MQPLIQAENRQKYASAKATLHPRWPKVRQMTDPVPETTRQTAPGRLSMQNDPKEYLFRRT